MRFLLVNLSNLRWFQHIKQEKASVVFDVVGDKMLAPNLAAKSVLNAVFDILCGFMKRLIHIFLDKTHKVEFGLQIFDLSSDFIDSSLFLKHGDKLGNA